MIFFFFFFFLVCSFFCLPTGNKMQCSRVMGGLSVLSPSEWIQVRFIEEEEEIIGSSINMINVPPPPYSLSSRHYLVIIIFFSPLSLLLSTLLSSILISTPLSSILISTPLSSLSISTHHLTITYIPFYHFLHLQETLCCFSTRT